MNIAPEVGAFGPVELTPTTFLDRAVGSFADHTAVVGQARTYTYREFGERCERLAGGLLKMGLGGGDVVSVLSPNTNVMLEAHFGVPLAGCVLNALNVRLSAGELAAIVVHAGTRVLIVDVDHLDVVPTIQAAAPHVRILVGGATETDYESLLAVSEPSRVPTTDELDSVALNYTSGTTGRPKGVVYQHRGAFLQALAMAAQARIGPDTVFLWTLPMFHCNGWCFPWAVTASGGTHVELRRVDPGEVWRAIADLGVTHFNAAPTVLASLIDHPDATPAPRTVRVMTGGAPPSPALLSRLEELNFDVVHLYGLTETYGPAVVCDWRPEWDDLPADERARLKARQGVSNLVGMGVRVVDDAGADVVADGAMLGEIVLRGNNVFPGYFNDAEATAEASRDGWFRTGDVGVKHPDGYIELRDRSKDVIISGGENIASIEVEQALESHPAVLECAVVASPDAKWGEVPVAFVTFRTGATATDEELIEHVRGRLARFKAPKRIIVGPLPKTGTGKIRKFELRQRTRTETQGTMP